jgi:hypothetical protein
LKDKLENKLHDLVCDRTMSLRSVQRQRDCPANGVTTRA